MDRDRIEFSSDTHGSLLNKVYEMANIRQREFAVMDMMSQSGMSSEDRLFSHTSSSCPSTTVVGGRLVQQPANGGYPINGQQLQMQMDQLAAAMSDMGVQDGMMEDALPPQYQAYLHHRAEMEADTAHFLPSPHSQEDRRRDPVYLATMAAHTAPPSPNNNTALQPQQQLLLIQQQQQQQQQLLIQQQQQQQQQQMSNRLSGCIQIAKDEHFGGCAVPVNMDGEFPVGGGNRLMKRPDMIPMQKCQMQWT